MKKKENIVQYTAEELEKMESLSDYAAAAAISDEELERLIREDPDEADFLPDWTTAKIFEPAPKEAVKLNLDKETVDFFRAGGRGHLSRMRSVLNAYVKAQQKAEFVGMLKDFKEGKENHSQK